MTITFPTIPAPQLRIKKYAVAGVAILAAAASIVAVQAAVTDSSPVAVTDRVVTESAAQPVSFDPGQNVTVDTGLGNAHLNELTQFATTNGLSGLSPASLGPVTDTVEQTLGATSFFLDINDAVGRIGGGAAEVAGLIPAGVFDTSALKDWAVANNMTGLSPASAGLVASPASELGAGGFASPDAFMRANTDSVAVAAAPATAVELGSGGFASPEAFMRANTDPVVEATTSTFDGSVAWLEANGWLPEVETAREALSRSNFGSDIDWLTANGWTNTD